MAGNLQIQGGAFSDFEGNPLSLGYLLFELSHDERYATSNSQIVAGLKLQVPLNSSGSVSANPAVFIYSNDQLTPTGSFYTVRAFKADGTEAWKSFQTFQLTNSPNPLDLGTLVPLNPPGGLVTGGGAGGTVTSVALTMPAEFSVAGSPITTSGTLAVTKANESANTVFAGPTSGAAAQPTFRALVGADLPVFSSGAFTQYMASGNNTPAVSANAIFLVPFTMPFNFSFSSMGWGLGTQDVTNLYDFGIYNLSGTRQCHTGAIHLVINGGGQSQFASVGSTTLTAGTYLHAFTGNVNSGNVFYGSSSNNLIYFSTATTSSSGVLPSSITVATSLTTGSAATPTMILF